MKYLGSISDDKDLVNKEYVDGHFTSTSVIPNNSGEIKTKYRVSNKGYTGSNSAVWYFPLVKLPVDNSGNYASLLISGRIGGWVSGNMSSISALVWNRDGTGIALLDIAGTATSMSSIWNICDIVVYTNSDNTDTVYLKAISYYTFDLDLELYQSTASILYDGSHSTSAPSGTLNAQASTSTKRVEIINGQLLVAGSGMVPTSRKVNNKALSADITLSASDVSAVPTSRKVNGKALSADITLSASDVDAQATLVSGTNIKTINNTSLLGSGNISISGGETNQNAFSYVSVDGTAISASTKTDTLKLSAGTNVTLTVNESDKKVTISNTGVVPSITLNGSSTTSPSFYAPTSAGTSGYYLKSSGSGAPTWAAFPSIPTIPSNNVTGSGTSGQLAQWNGTHTITSGPKITVSTSGPSGGNNGDIWFVHS